MQDIHDTKHDARVAPKGLPFEFEDRSDGRHDRVLREIEAAWRWSQSRRARGLLPS